MHIHTIIVKQRSCAESVESQDQGKRLQESKIYHLELIGERSLGLMYMMLVATYDDETNIYDESSDQPMLVEEVEARIHQGTIEALWKEESIYLLVPSTRSLLKT